MMLLWVIRGDDMLARDYTLRVCVVFVCFFALFMIIAMRLFLVQIRQQDFFKILAKHQYEHEITLNPARAVVYDRSGVVPLALNREVHSAFIVPEQLIESKKAMKFIKRQYPEAYQRIVSNPDKKFLWLDRKLTSEKYNNLKALGFEDIHFISEHQRFYPFNAASQLVGFTDIDNVGIAGIELGFTQRLGGVPTTIKLEKDARSGVFYFGKKVRKQGEVGKPVVLTIDSSLQSLAYHALKQSVDDLKAQAGSVVVLDPDTGQVLAMTNYPTFDPNQKSVPTLAMMKNSAVCECYELGSVMKAFCALAALEEQVVGFDEPIDCEGRFAFVDKVKVENPTLTLLRVLKENNNILPFHNVVRYSSNVGIAKVAQRLDQRLYLHLRRLGFGSKTKIQFPGERTGFVNPPDRWSRPSLVVMSFGYELMVSPMQLAKAFGIIANGGHAFDVTLLKNDRSQKKKGRKLYGDTSIEQMKCILEKTCERFPIPGFRVMGKTGTARCVKDGKYSEKDHNYTFAGIIEKGDYRRVIVTFIREPEKAALWASEVSLPLFNKIAQSMVVRDVMHQVVTLSSEG